MSYLSDTTEKNAVRVIQKILPLLAQLDGCGMTASDAFDARKAENLLRGIAQGSPHYKP